MPECFYIGQQYLWENPGATGPMLAVFLIQELGHRRDDELRIGLLITTRVVRIVRVGNMDYLWHYRDKRGLDFEAMHKT